MPLIVEWVEDGWLFMVCSVDEQTRRDNNWCWISRLVLRLSFFMERGRVGDTEFMPIVVVFALWETSFEGRFEHMHNIIVEK